MRVAMASASPDRHVHVLLADRPGAARRAIAGVLHGLPTVAAVSEVSTSDDLGRELIRTGADVVIIDDRLLSRSRIDLHDASLPIIVVGLDDDPGFALRARQLGAMAWVPKERADELLPGVLTEASRRGAG